MRNLWLRRFFFAACLISTLDVRVCGQAQSATSALVEAIRRRDLPQARRIIESGIELNAFDEQGVTPLTEAIGDRLSALAEELVSAGADPNFTGGKGGDTPLMVASWYCDVGVAKFLLEHGALVNARNSDGETALISASQTCLDGEVVKHLLKAGADP